MIRDGSVILLVSLIAAGWAYWVIAWVSARAFLTRGSSHRSDASFHPRVSILKPIKGIDNHAFENFATFARQDYDNYEILFAVIDSHDPAISEIHRLQQQFPDISIRLLIAEKLGVNPKCANLHRLAAESTADVLVISDSDIRVTPDYLSRVIAPLAEASVGLVTCLYRGLLSEGLPACLESLHMDAVFLPSVVLAHRLGQRVGIGATLALCRADLLRTGGFEAIADHLMDDYQLAALIEGLGLKTRLSEYVVGSVIGESRFSDQWAREVRWSRGIRVTCPGKYWGLLITYPTAWALVLCVAGGLHAWMAMILAGTLLLRWLIAWDIEKLLSSTSTGNSCFAPRRYAKLQLLPVRDMLSFVTWCAGIAGDRITWRGQDFVLHRDGRLRPREAADSRRPGLFDRVVRRLDRFLRKREGIFEYCTDADCVLRVSFGVCDERLNLSDGAFLHPGDVVCDLHLFNDHIPAIGCGGPDIAWANSAQRRFRGSLQKLAAALVTDARFANVKALRARTSFVFHGGARQFKRFAARLHFDLQDPANAPPLTTRLHDLGENLLVWALVRTFNPGGLQNARLMRKRHRFFMSREMLLDNYGRDDAKMSKTVDRNETIYKSDR